MRQIAVSLPKRRTARAARAGRLAGTLVVLLGAGCWGPAARADDAPTHRAAIEDGPLLDAPDYAPLRAAWHEVQADLARRAWTETVGRLQHLVNIRADLGLPNVFQLSSVLLHGARAAQADGSSDAAASMAAAALALSPDMAAPHFERARHTFEATPIQLSAQIRDIRGGIERLAVDLPAAMAATGNLVTALTYAVVLALILFALAIIVRYRELAANDLRRLLPAGVNTLQANLFLGTLLVAPFLAGFGILSTCTLWIAIAALYMRPAERVVALLLLAGLFAAPTATLYTVRALGYSGSEQATLYRCNQSLCSTHDRELLRQWTGTNAMSYESGFTVGLVLKRAAAATDGDYVEATQYLARAREQRETPEVLVELGNIAYLEALSSCPAMAQKIPGALGRWEQHTRKALTLWDSALGKDPSSLPALYNSSVVLRQSGDHEAAGPRLEKAMALDTTRVMDWNKKVAKEQNLTRCRMMTQGNRHLMDAPLPTVDLRAMSLAADVPNDDIVLPFGGFLTGRLGIAAVGGLGAAAAALVLLLAFLGGVLRHSKPCIKCGSVADPETRLDVERGAVCEACLLADVRRALVDAKEQWFREKQREAGAVARARRSRLVTWVLPGFGHILRGHPIRGIAVLTTIASCFVLGLGLHAVVQDPWDPPGIGGGRLAIFGTVAAITYLLALVDTHTGGTGR